MGLNDDVDSVLIMSDTKIKEVVTDPNQKMILVYDFMRMWCFLIEHVETLPKNVTQPQISLSVGKAPAEESKEMDASGMGYGESLDLGNDFDDIFLDDDDDDLDDDDLDMEGYTEHSDESDPYQ